MLAVSKLLLLKTIALTIDACACLAAVDKSRRPRERICARSYPPARRPAPRNAAQVVAVPAVLQPDEVEKRGADAARRCRMKLDWR